MKCADLQRNIMFLAQTPIKVGGGKVPKNVFAGNCTEHHVSNPPLEEGLQKEA